MTTMNKAYLLIGGNMGKREGFLADARVALQNRCGRLTGQSSLYQTAAWGLEAQAPFLNQALVIETLFSASRLLQTALTIEEALGRLRQQRYGPRVIDIDLLLFNEEIIQTSELTVPHPQLPYRRFALAPLAEIAPAAYHPVLKKTVQQLLDECPDHLPVHKIS